VSRRLGLWAAAATGVQVGAGAVLSRAALTEIGPLTLAALRYLIGAAVLLPVVLALRPARLRRGDGWPVALLGTAQFGLLIAFLNFALTRIGAAEAALIFATSPVLTVLFAGALGRERLSLARFGGALLTLAGVALALGAHPGAAASAVDAAGAVAAFLAALTSAVTAIATRPYLQRNPTLSVGLPAMAAAALALGLAALPFEGLPAPPSTRLALLTMAVGLLSGAGYLIWLFALRHAEAGEATVLLGLSPITATLLGAAFLGEHPAPGLWLGTAVALAGVTLTVLPPGALRRRKRLAERPSRR
jgi:drug/metabolite transporter (DMT)-like permease